MSHDEEDANSDLHSESSDRGSDQGFDQGFDEEIPYGFDSDMETEPMEEVTALPPVYNDQQSPALPPLQFSVKSSVDPPVQHHDVKDFNNIPPPRDTKHKNGGDATAHLSGQGASTVVAPPRRGRAVGLAPRSGSGLVTFNSRILVNTYDFMLGTIVPEISTYGPHGNVWNTIMSTRLERGV